MPAVIAQALATSIDSSDVFIAISTGKTVGADMGSTWEEYLSEERIAEIDAAVIARIQVRHY